MGWVVRAGEAKAADLVGGYHQHLNVPGLYGFSVQYAATVPWQELARAGQFPNAKVSIAVEQDLRLVPSPGAGYHHTFVVPYDATGTMLTHLAFPIAQKRYETFAHVPNPHRVRPRRTP